MSFFRSLNPFDSSKGMFSGSHGGNIMGSILTGGMSDVVRGGYDLAKGGDFWESIDKAIPFNSIVNPLLGEVGEHIVPREMYPVLDIAGPVAGGIVGGIYGGPWGAAGGAAGGSLISSKITGKKPKQALPKAALAGGLAGAGAYGMEALGAGAGAAGGAGTEAPVLGSTMGGEALPGAVDFGYSTTGELLPGNLGTLDAGVAAGGMGGGAGVEGAAFAEPGMGPTGYVSPTSTSSSFTDIPNAVDAYWEPQGTYTGAGYTPSMTENAMNLFGLGDYVPDFLTGSSGAAGGEGFKMSNAILPMMGLGLVSDTLGGIQQKKAMKEASDKSIAAAEQARQQGMWNDTNRAAFMKGISGDLSTRLSSLQRRIGGGMADLGRGGGSYGKELTKAREQNAETYAKALAATYEPKYIPPVSGDLYAMQAYGNQPWYSSLLNGVSSTAGKWPYLAALGYMTGGKT